MALQKNYLTQERYEELRKEIETLKTEGRRSVADRLRHAKDLGDLSENAEYQAAREDQARLESHLNELEELIRNSAIIKKETTGGSTVRIGSRVTVRKGSEERKFTIVGSNEAKPLEGFISNESPIGKALLGKKAGDIVSVKAPNGTVEYTVVTIG